MAARLPRLIAYAGQTNAAYPPMSRNCLMLLPPTLHVGPGARESPYEYVRSKARRTATCIREHSKRVAIKTLSRSTDRRREICFRPDAVSSTNQPRIRLWEGSLLPPAPTQR